LLYPQIVKPYQLWEKAHITLCFLLGVHLEEFLFWTWLLQVIRSKQSKSWFKSVVSPERAVLGCTAAIDLTGADEGCDLEWSSISSFGAVES
jgi:hypothetical protein